MRPWMFKKAICPFLTKLIYKKIYECNKNDKQVYRKIGKCNARLYFCLMKGGYRVCRDCKDNFVSKIALGKVNFVNSRQRFLNRHYLVCRMFPFPKRKRPFPKGRFPHEAMYFAAKLPTNCRSKGFFP
jgi:hypothetical protein